MDQSQTASELIGNTVLLSQDVPLGLPLEIFPVLGAIGFLMSLVALFALLRSGIRGASDKPAKAPKEKSMRRKKVNRDTRFSERLSELA